MSAVMRVTLTENGLGDYIFGLDSQLLIDFLITIIAMIALFVLLSYLLFNPARNMLEKRQERIREEMETAAIEKENAIAFKSEYDTKLKEIDKEADQILSETRRKALKKEKDIIHEAKKEAARILERADRDVALEKNRVKDEVKHEMVNVATVMAGKIVASSLDEEKQSQLIAETLKEMGDETWLS